MVDRASESGALLEAARRARTRRRQVVILEGEHGAGKTWLLRQVLGSLPDVAATWVEVEPAGSAGQVIEDIRSRFAAANAAGIARAMSDRAGDRLPCLIVDDADLLDEVSADGIRALIRAMPTPGLVVLAAATETPLLAELRVRDAAGDNGSIVTLGGLTTAQTAELLAESGLTGLPARIVETLAELTDGNPLHVTAVATRYGDRLRASVPRDLPLPPGYEAHVDRLLDGLSPEGRSVLELLATVGEPAGLPLLTSAAADLGLAVSFTDALATGVVDVIDDAGQREFALASARMRETLRRRIPAGRRRDLHGAIAARVGGRARFEHRLAATELTDDALASDLEREARRLRDAGRFADSLWYAARAIGVASTQADRDRLAVDAMVGALLATDVAEATSLAPVLERAAPSYARDVALAAVDALSGRFAAALAGLERAESSPDSGAFLPGFAQLVEATAAWGLGDLGRVLQATAGDPGSTGLGGRLLLHRAHAQWLTGGPEASAATIDRLVGLGSGRPERAAALTLRAQQAQYAGDVPAALAAFDQAVDAAEAVGADALTQLALAGRALVGLMCGRWKSAVRDAERVLAASDEVADSEGRSGAHSVLAILAAAAGRLEDAAEHAEVARRLARDRPTIQNTGLAAVAAAMTALAAGPRAAVVTVLHPFSDGRLATPAAILGVVEWAPPLAAALAADDPDRAEALLDGIPEPRHPYLGYPGWARAAIAATRGEPRTAEAILAAALDTGDAHRFPGAHALALRALADLAERDGRASEADRLRREARRVVEGALPSAPPPSADVVAHLTPRERETAALAAQGRTNREIAAELYVSVKTVEYHLGKALAKLGLTSRRELGRAAGLSGPDR